MAKVAARRKTVIDRRHVESLLFPKSPETASRGIRFVFNQFVL